MEVIFFIVFPVVVLVVIVMVVIFFFFASLSSFLLNVFVSLLFSLSMSGLGCLQVFKIDFQDCF